MKFLADENFNNIILRGLQRRLPDLDIVRAQDVGLTGWDDPQVLEWANQENRLILTHDVQTMAGFAYVRVVDAKPMVGVFEIPRHVQINVAIEQLVLIIECSQPDEWENKVTFIPL